MAKSIQDTQSTSKTSTEDQKEWVVNTTKFTEDTPVKFVANPKRKGSKAHTRYEKYSKASTWGEYLKLSDSKFAMADARYDMSKEFLKTTS